MKASFMLLAGVLLLSFGAPSARAVFITFEEFPSSPSAQDPATPYYDNPIAEEYADWGVHFKSGPATPSSLALTLYGGDMFTASNWPGSVFPVLPPTTRYLGLDKPAGSNPVFTGIVIVLDEPSTYLGFEHRRPGQNLTTETVVNIALFDTRRAGWEASPIKAPDQIRVYVDPSQHGVTDENAWLPFSLDLDVSLPFNLVLFYSDKKFAIDNLEIYGQWDLDRDNDVDGADLAVFAEGLGSALDEEDLAEFAARFGS